MITQNELEEGKYLTFVNAVIWLSNPTEEYGPLKIINCHSLHIRSVSRYIIQLAGSNSQTWHGIQEPIGLDEQTKNTDPRFRTTNGDSALFLPSSLSQLDAINTGEGELRSRFLSGKRSPNTSGYRLTWVYPALGEDITIVDSTELPGYLPTVLAKIGVPDISIEAVIEDILKKRDQIQ